MHQKIGRRCQKMREMGRVPPVGNKTNARKGRSRSARIQDTDTQAYINQLHMWASYVVSCQENGEDPKGVHPSIMEDLERLAMI